MAFLYVLLGIAACLALAWLGFNLWRFSIARGKLREADRLNAGGGISLVETVTLGGIDQAILIQGEDRSNPVLLFIHGGPSMPVPGVSGRGEDYLTALTTSELTRHYVVVYWDQRGTGRSYDKRMKHDDLSFEQYLSDAAELVDYLRDRFQKRKIHLAAHSWGTCIGLTLAARLPEKLHSYTGISQVVSWNGNDELVYPWLLEQARARGKTKIVQEMTRIGPPPYRDVQSWKKHREWVMNLGGMLHSDDRVTAPAMSRVMRPMLTSPDYGLKHLAHAFYHGFQLAYQKRLIDELQAMDLRRSVPRVEIPVQFLHGRHDHNVPGELAESLFSELEAPNGKTFTWLDASSHILHPTDARRVEQHLLARTAT